MLKILIPNDLHYKMPPRVPPNLVQKTLTGKTIPDNIITLPMNRKSILRTLWVLIQKGRGKTRGKGVEHLKNMTGKKMVIDIQVGKGRPTNKVQSARLSNKLGIIARNFLSVPTKWKELTRDEKDVALVRCNERFEIKIDENYVKDCCEDILKNRTRQWRYKLKKIYESARSIAEARRIEVPGLSQENWNRLVDMWSDPEHQQRCEVNKVNRSKVTHKHFMGSKAFVAARTEIGNDEFGGVEPDRIEFYKRTYYSTDKGWSSSEAENNYKQMIDLKEIYCSGESPMTTDEIVDSVLGKKSGYVKGLGYGPKPAPIIATQRRIAELEDSLRKSKEEASIVQHDLQEQLNAAKVMVANQQSQIQDLTSKLSSVLTQQDDILKQMKQFRISPSSN